MVALPVTLQDRAAASDAFRTFYAADYAAVARYAWRLVGDVEAAHDLAQEAMARTWSRWRSVDEPRAYAFRITTNLARKAWRRQADDALAVSSLGALAAVVGSHVDGPETGTAVRDAVRGMPRRLREVVLLHYFADLRVEDVATATGRPLGTVKRQLAEARSALALALADDETSGARS